VTGDAAIDGDPLPADDAHPAVPFGDGTAAAVAELPAPIAVLRERPVAVTGASGFVGAHVCATLARAGWRVRALVHDSRRAAVRLAHLPVELHPGDIRDEGFLAGALAGCVAVVHLAAVAIERAGAEYDDVNARATGLLLHAARAAGARRVLHMSQNGSDCRSPFRFLRSKGVAQDLVTASGLDWTVFRPSVIFGAEDEFTNVIARLALLTPWLLPLPDGGRATFQPIGVQDVAAAVALALGDPATTGGIYPLGGAVPLALRQMTERILLALGRRRRIVSLPLWAARPLVAVLTRVLPAPPVTPALLDLLAVDNTVPDNSITTAFGITPTPFAPEELDYVRRITVRGALRSVLARA